MKISIGVLPLEGFNSNKSVYLIKDIRPTIIPRAELFADSVYIRKIDLYLEQALVFIRFSYDLAPWVDHHGVTKIVGLPHTASMVFDPRLIRRDEVSLILDGASTD